MVRLGGGDDRGGRGHGGGGGGIAEGLGLRLPGGPLCGLLLGALLGFATLGRLRLRLTGSLAGGLGGLLRFPTLALVGLSLGCGLGRCLRFRGLAGGLLSGLAGGVRRSGLLLGDTPGLRSLGCIGSGGILGGLAGRVGLPVLLGVLALGVTGGDLVAGGVQLGLRGVALGSQTVALDGELPDPGVVRLDGGARLGLAAQGAGLALLGDVAQVAQFGLAVGLLRAELVELLDRGALLLGVGAQVGLAVEGVVGGLLTGQRGDGGRRGGATVGGAGDLVEAGLGLLDLLLGLVELGAGDDDRLAGLLGGGLGVVQVDERLVDLLVEATDLQGETVHLGLGAGDVVDQAGGRGLGRGVRLGGRRDDGRGDGRQRCRAQRGGDHRAQTCAGQGGRGHVFSSRTRDIKLAALTRRVPIRWIIGVGTRVSRPLVMVR